MSNGSEDAKGAFLLLAITGADVHPTRLARLAIGRSDLVIDRRNALRSKRVDVAKRTLVVASCLRDLFLSQSRSRQQARCSHEEEDK